MVQWMAGVEITYRTINGEVRKIKDWRKRMKYSEDTIFLSEVKAGEELRVDTMCQRLLSSILAIDKLIDVNDTDLLSANESDELRYYSGLTS